MQGRIEHTLQREQSIEKKLKDLPSYMTEYYYAISANLESVSVLSYINIINQYICFISSLGKEPNFIELQNNVAQFLKSKETRIQRGTIVQSSSANVTKIHSALKNFMEFLCSKRYITDNPMVFIKRIKRKDEVKRYKLNISDLNDIITAVDYEQGTGRERQIQLEWKSRNKLILLLFMNTGMRETALSEINLSDIDFENNILRIIDKGSKHHEYQIDHLIVYIQDWLRKREQLMRGYHANDALFISERRTRISSKAIIDIVGKVSMQGLGYRITPHKLRAAFCTIMYEETKDIEFVRQAVGHSNVAVTQRYIVSDNSARKQSALIMAKGLGM